MKREPKYWITVKGVHVPIYDGQDTRQAIEEHFKQTDIEKNKKVADGLNEKRSDFKEGNKEDLIKRITAECRWEAKDAKKSLKLLSNQKWFEQESKERFENHLAFADHVLSDLQKDGVKSLITPSEEYAGEIMWNASVTDRETGKYHLLTFSAKDESSARSMIAQNGYTIRHGLLLPPILYDYLVSKTNMSNEERFVIKQLAKAALKGYGRG